MLLVLKSNIPKLKKLVHDLLTIDLAKPEVFVALSILWEMKDDRPALTNVEKVRLSGNFILFIFYGSKDAKSVSGQLD